MANPNQTMITRLRQEMAKCQINARELAEKAAVGRSFVYDVLSGKSANPTYTKLAAIAEVLEVSVPYLVGGEDSSGTRAIFPEGFSESADSAISVPTLIVESTNTGNALITDENEERPYYFRRLWVEERLKVRPEDLRIVFVSGDSMEPTLADGDMVLIDVRRRKISPPGIFVLFDGNGLLVKRVEGISSNNIKVMSDNQQYYSYDTNIDDVDIVGRVIWFAREL